MKQNRLTAGNIKIDKSVLIFNLPARKSCPNKKLCASTCYAYKAEVQYPDAKAWRAENFKLAKDPAKLYKLLDIQLSRTSKESVRIHESGDYFSQSYIDMWTDLARRHPDIMFFSYTKTLELFDFAEFSSLPNVNILSSLTSEGELNYGSLPYCLELRDAGYHICPCIGKIAIRCGIDCKYCMVKNNDKVCFVIH